MAVRLLSALVAFAVLCGCGQTSSSVEKHEKKTRAEHTKRAEAPQPTPELTTQIGTSAEGGSL